MRKEEKIIDELIVKLDEAKKEIAELRESLKIMRDIMEQMEREAQNGTTNKDNTEGSI